jgi:hypothetical protein
MHVKNERGVTIYPEPLQELAKISTERFEIFVDNHEYALIAISLTKLQSPAYVLQAAATRGRRVWGHHSRKRVFLLHSAAAPFELFVCSSSGRVVRMFDIAISIDENQMDNTKVVTA